MCLVGFIDYVAAWHPTAPRTVRASTVLPLPTSCAPYQAHQGAALAAQAANVPAGLAASTVC